MVSCELQSIKLTAIGLFYKALTIYRRLWLTQYAMRTDVFSFTMQKVLPLHHNQFHQQDWEKKHQQNV